MQSDYINLKKQSVLLRKQEDLAKVLSSQMYTDMKSYSLEKTVYMQPQIFDITTTLCRSNVVMCCNTNARPNRQLNAPNNEFNKSYILNANNEYWSFLKKNYKLCPSGEFKQCDEFIHNRGVRWNNGIHKKRYLG
jgi:hypothetical protein